MRRQDVEKTVTEYLKPVFGFALKRCKNACDAEDLSQEIVLKAFRALLAKDDVEDMGKFIWTVAHNALNNYYRDSAKSMIGVSIDEVHDILADPLSVFDGDDYGGSIRRLQSEIAYLSKLQRRIIIEYYFENRRQADIADRLGIPLGTVKWHLFEAKKELKRGMISMRKEGELKFNPIKFEAHGISGTVGSKSYGEFFRSLISQNICYSVRNTAKTVSEIADDLGVSPVYVEGEAEFLAEYGFLTAQKDKYIANFIIEEPTNEYLAIRENVYKKAASLFANDLYDELTKSGVLTHSDIVCHQTDGEVTVSESDKADENFILWSLIPYIAALSGEKLMDKKVSFEEAATIRPDGGHNIFKAVVASDDLTYPVHVKNWCGPMWGGDDKNIFWKIDSEWCWREEGQRGFLYFDDAVRALSLYEREKAERLSKDEYAWLAERGYVKTNGDYDGNFRSAWQIVVLESEEIKKKLLSVGDRIKEKHKDEFDKLKAPYVEAVLSSTPEHLKRVAEYELQYAFHADGLFIYNCIKELLGNGKLKEPTENQRKSLITLILPN